jgi:glycosyltransferase involved in cell wall biosynthesis
MNIIYVSSLCSQEKYTILFPDNKHRGNQQIQKYHRLLVEGFIANNVNVNAISSPPINRENTKEKVIKGDMETNSLVKYTYLPTINIRIIKNICDFITSFFRTLQLCVKYRESVIICDVLNISISIGAIIASKLTRNKSVGVITDLPSMQSNSSNKLLVKVNNYFIDKFSSYVFLTHQMKYKINTKNKPFIVIEGQVDSKMKDRSNELSNKYDKKICHYAGGLQKKYGIDKLVKSFIKSNVENSELHLYGRGDFEKELKEICNLYSSIKYFGIAPNEYVVSEQLKSTLLINPRPTNGEYTKYSFPSKNMEYMASGTPVLTTKLPGMPKEYYEYVYLIENETEEGIVKVLKEVLNKPSVELHQKGLRAKEFVLKEKNNVVQVKRILNMILKGC